jgi:hypothetical protein
MVDYSDLVARLRNAGIDASDDWVIMQVAATALEALSARERVLREALEETVAALSFHACHGGEGIPCLRTEDQCRAACGKAAGDAFIVGSSALTNQDGGEKLNNPLSIAEKGV